MLGFDDALDTLAAEEMSAGGYAWVVEAVVADGAFLGGVSSTRLVSVEHAHLLALYAELEQRLKSFRVLRVEVQLLIGPYKRHQVCDAVTAEFPVVTGLAHAEENF